MYLDGTWRPICCSYSEQSTMLFATLWISNLNMSSGFKWIQIDRLTHASMVGVLWSVHFACQLYKKNLHQTKQMTHILDKVSPGSKCLERTNISKILTTPLHEPWQLYWFWNNFVYLEVITKLIVKFPIKIFNFKDWANSCTLNKISKAQMTSLKIKPFHTFISASFR